MADEKKKDKPKRLDETIPGGAYIRGGHPGDDDKHYGGQVVNAEGEVLNEFEDDEVNTGQPKAKAKPGEAPAPLKPETDPKPPADNKPPAKPEGK